MPGKQTKKTNLANAKQAKAKDEKAMERKKNRKNARKLRAPRGIARFDATRVAASPNAQVLPLGTSVPTIPYIASLNNNALRVFITGYLSNTMVRGGVARTDVSDYPLAFQFMGECIQSALTGQNYVGGNIPYWFRNILHALQPKVVNKEMGKASYSFASSGNSPTLSTPTIPFGAGAWGYDFSYQLPNSAGTPINGFPPCTLFAPAPYTQAGGSAAFEKFAQLMNDAPTGGAPNPMNVLVPSTEPTKYLKDVSAFAISAPKQGFGANNTGQDAPGGCFAQNVQLEVPIHHPILASIGGGSDITNRYDNFITSFGGDATFLSGMCSSILHPAEMAMKRQPRFHQVDFLEFGEVLALFVQGVQQASAAEGNISTDLNALQCPLTLQEVLLLLRNIMMQAFRDTQPSVQGMGMLKPSTATDNFFAPFLCAPGTCPIATTPMILPVPLIENIRALVYRKLHMGRGKSAGDSLYWIPILGKYVADTLTQSDYTYSYTQGGNPEVVVPSFKDPTSIWRRRGSISKDGSAVRMLAEASIDFVDGFSGSTYVAINDPTKLNELTVLWNKWWTENSLSSHSCQTTQWSTDLGISILTSINMCRHAQHVATFSPEKQTRMEERIWEDTRLATQKMKGVMLSPYASRFAIQDTSSSTMLSAPYDTVQGTWILPTNLVALTSVSGNAQSTQLQRVQGLYGEEFSQSLTTNDVGQLMSEIHSRYAAKMVKGAFTQETQWDVYFKEAEKMGRGGILSSLLGGVAKGLFPSASGVIDQVAGLVPF